MHTVISTPLFTVTYVGRLLNNVAILWSAYHRETRPLPRCNMDDVYTLMTDLSQSVLGLLSFIVAIESLTRFQLTLVWSDS